MFRPTVLFNAASRVAAVRAPVSRTVAPAVFTRLYSAGHASVESRVLDILRGFDKIDESKVSLDAHFVNDLGLDSLDTVEVIMAVEEEFSVEITDKDADDIKTAKQAIEYISKRADAH
ncbi:acyl carrier protein-like protein [Circinella umbellata]|nr:acyl carrier protein-like protein [Circinella umbellata]